MGNQLDPFFIRKMGPLKNKKKGALIAGKWNQWNEMSTAKAAL